MNRRCNFILCGFLAGSVLSATAQQSAPAAPAPPPLVGTLAGHPDWPAAKNPRDVDTVDHLAEQVRAQDRVTSTEFSVCLHETILAVSPAWLFYSVGNFRPNHAESVTSSQRKHEGEPSLALCHLLDRTRANSDHRVSPCSNSVGVNWLNTGVQRADILPRLIPSNELVSNELPYGKCMAHEVLSVKGE